jgi:hypothetical protein
VPVTRARAANAFSMKINCENARHLAMPSLVEPHMLSDVGHCIISILWLILRVFSISVFVLGSFLGLLFVVGF